MFYQNNPYLSFFVYGTLRPGEWNYHLLSGCVLQEQPASVPGFLLYSLGSFPMAILPNTTPATALLHGVLVTVDPQCYEEVIYKLDQLEDYRPQRPQHSMYWRIQYPIGVGDSIVTAWVYLGNPEYLHPAYPLITSGDWVQYRQQGF